MRANNIRLKLVVFLICWIVASVHLHAVESATAQSNSSSTIDSAVQSSFGSTVEPVKGFKPYYLIGDFNGDGRQDALVVVRMKTAGAELPKDLRLMNPFRDLPKVDARNEKRLALAIIHDWKAPQPGAKFLLIGESPVLTLQYDRAVSGRAENARNLMSLMKRRGPRPKGQKFPPTAKSDVILLITEVGDNSMLYWDGRSYCWKEVEDDAQGE
jgi:hypothetical protein